MSNLDTLVIVLYGALVLAVGWTARRRHPSAADLHLGGRDLPAPAILASLVATELSAATFIGVPQAAYVGDWSYLQLAFGALFGKVVVAIVVIPAYYRRGVTTVYGFLGERLGGGSRRAAALAFVGGRILASGVRLFIAALAFATATGSTIELAIVVSGAVAGLYTLFGGIRSVVWTDVLQAFVFLLGAGALLFTLATNAPGGMSSILDWANGFDRTRIFHLEPLFSLSASNTFGVGLLGGFFLTLATHSTDHDMVQRLLCARSGRAGAWTLATSALANFPLSGLFLLIGTGIAFHYSTAPPMAAPLDVDRIVPLFALQEMPTGLRGLVFAGLFAAAMSSLDSAICALSTTWSVDVLSQDASETRSVRRTRWATVAFTGLIVVAALAMAAYDRLLEQSPGESSPLNLVEFALSSMTVLYGGLLGIFASALLFRRLRDRAGMVALAVGAGIGLALFLQPVWLGEVRIAWPWWIPISAGLTATTAIVGSRLR